MKLSMIFASAFFAICLTFFGLFETETRQFFSSSMHMFTFSMFFIAMIATAYLGTENVQKAFAVVIFWAACMTVVMACKEWDFVPENRPESHVFYRRGFLVVCIIAFYFVAFAAWFDAVRTEKIRSGIKVLTIFSILVFCSSCFDSARFKFTDGQTVVVDQRSLDEYEVGDTVWLIKSYGASSGGDWEILEGFTAGQIGFEPKKDTTFIFNSQGGDYQRAIKKAELQKKL